MQENLHTFPDCHLPVLLGRAESHLHATHTIHKPSKTSLWACFHSKIFHTVKEKQLESSSVSSTRTLSIKKYLQEPPALLGLCSCCQQTWLSWALLYQLTPFWRWDHHTPWSTFQKDGKTSWIPRLCCFLAVKNQANTTWKKICIAEGPWQPSQFWRWALLLTHPTTFWTLMHFLLYSVSGDRRRMDGHGTPALPKNSPNHSSFAISLEFQQNYL